MIDREPEAGFIRQLLLECGGQLRRLRQEQQMEPRQKRGYTDLVTQHDRWAQDFLASRIAKQYPAHGLLGEEGLDRRGNSPWLWVIDPIDGTSNYIYWGREYAISLGLFFQGKPWYGAVLDVESMELHESPAAPQPPVPGGDARHGVLHVGFQTLQEIADQGGDPWGLCGAFSAVRYLGCASLELCHLAQGEPGAYVNSHLRLWDFAGALPVLQRAGCSLRALPMGSGHYFVCAYSAAGLGQACLPWLPPTVRRQLEQGKGEEFHVEN